MTEPADQPLLTEPAGDTPKPTRRRAPAARATPSRRAEAAAAVAAPAAAEAHQPEVADAKPKKGPAATRPRKAPPRKSATAIRSDAAAEDASPARDELPGLEIGAPVRRKAAPRRAKKGSVEPVLTPVEEEWSPTRHAPAASAPPATGNGQASLGAPPPPSPPAPAPESGGATRKYPVYIPRHVARQMEEQGQTAPIAVSADAIPESARAAVEAAEAARAERAAQHAQHMAARAEARGGDSRPETRPERHGRHDRHERHPRGERPDRPDRPERGERPDRFERTERDHDSMEPNRLPAEPGPDEEMTVSEGIVEISGKGFGFIRDPKRGFNQHPSDIFVTPETVRRYNLRDGQWLKGDVRRGGRGSQLHQLITINGDDPEGARVLPAFDELTVISPMERILMETTPERSTTRLIDLFTPIGKGQRGIIVAPPRTGKTTLLQHLADAVLKKHPEIVLIILLVDERPEEVTDIKRTLHGAEVMASSNDSDTKSHTRIAQLAIERAKRLVESGKDVFILLDSITRVGRAFNNALTSGGRTGTGGLDNRALEIPRRLFAAARNTEEAGSLTIVATALIETGSMMDDRIFQEFKGTGNMEIVLDRKIADMRIYPAIDMFQSGTRREELLIPADDLHKINILRRGLAGHKPLEAIERLLFFLRKFPTNAQMLKEIPG